MLDDNRLAETRKQKIISPDEYAQIPGDGDVISEYDEVASS